MKTGVGLESATPESLGDDCKGLITAAIELRTYVVRIAARTSLRSRKLPSSFMWQGFVNIRELDQADSVEGAYGPTGT